MKYSEIKAVKQFCNSLFSEPNWREVVENIDNDKKDFEVDNVRFIEDSSILEIMAEEIFSDNYTLGCFNANFIASNSDLNYELVKACQENEAFEAIGQALNDTLIQSDKEAFCEDYASCDGYGHHFNSYDFNEEEFNITVNDTVSLFFHVFDNH